jgi:5-methylcytosine-specific restriction endonuclease McrA
MNRSVLVLNNTYEAIHICTLKRAIILVIKGVAVIEESLDTGIHSATMVFRTPTVIRLIRYIWIPRKNVHLTRRNVVLRDKNICQYCGHEFKSEDLTIDHIVPRSMGGQTAWENVVACCKSCNNRKANRPLKDSGMRLIKKPEMPKKIIYLHIVRYLGRDIDNWKKYIFY